MPEDKSLLSFVARRHSQGLEDAATDALYYILSRSTSARLALSHFLSHDQAPLHIAKVSLQASAAHGATPDLSCLDRDGKMLAFVESKFWATLTHNQPVTYWESLPANRPSVLLFLAPQSRVNDDYLWNELVDRLSKADHEIGPADRNETRIAAPSNTDTRHLMLTSWRSLLGFLAQRTKKDGDSQATFEISELQGLTSDVITKGKPKRDENLKRLIAEALKRLEQSGWANTDGLSAGHGYDYYHRYHYLAGAIAALRIDYTAIKETPDKPLWLRFGNFVNTPPTTSTEQVRSILEGSDEPGWKMHGSQISLSINLPAGADHDATLGAIVDQMERIAQLIDPNGPTYQN